MPDSNTETKEAPEERVLYFHGKKGVEYDGAPNHDLLEWEYRMFFGTDEQIDRNITQGGFPWSWAKDDGPPKPFNPDLVEVGK